MEGNLSEVRARQAKDAASLYEAQSDMARKLIQQQAVGYAVGFQEVVAENQQSRSCLLRWATTARRWSRAPAPRR